MCDSFGTIGAGFSSCLNGGSGSCPKHGCESTCDGTALKYTGFTHSYFDCHDTLHIDTTQCANCPIPKPTPTPTPSCGNHNYNMMHDRPEGEEYCNCADG